MTDIIINNIFDKNKIEDLNRFLKERETINKVNKYFNYAYTLFQTTGILTVSIGQSYNLSYIVWIGVSINSIATIIHIWEKTNKTISKSLLNNIKMIKNNKYIDEGYIEYDTRSSSEKNGTSTPNLTTNKSINNLNYIV